MGILDRGSKAGFAVSMLVARGLFAMLLFVIGSTVIGGLLGIVLPGGLASTIAALATVGLLGVHYFRTWPVWGTTTEYRAYNEFNPSERTERIDPDDVAEILSAIGDQTTADGQLKGVNTRATLKLARAIYRGTRGDADAQRVIAQLGRLEGCSTEEAATLAMERLTTLFEAADRPVIERALWKVRNAGWFLIIKGFEGMNDEPTNWSDIRSPHEEIQTAAVLAITEFANTTPPDGEAMREAMDSEYELVRGQAAYAYGWTAFFDPSRSDEVTNTLIPLTNDPEKEVRVGATHGLAPPAYHSEAARERLTELRNGPDPDLRGIADEIMTTVEAELGSDGMNVDDAPAEHAVDAEELAAHGVDLDASLDEEPTADRELGL